MDSLLSTFMLARMKDSVFAYAVFIFILVTIILLAGFISKQINLARLRRIRSTMLSRGLRFVNGPPEPGVLAPVLELATRVESTVWSAAGQLDGFDVTVLEHAYVINTGEDRKAHKHSVVSFKLPTAWPGTSAYIEKTWHRVRERLGPQDFRPEDEEFDERFRIHSSDAAFARRLFSPEVEEAMMRWPSSLTLSLTGERLCLVWDGHFNSIKWELMLLEAVRFRKAIPPELDAWGAA